MKNPVTKSEFLSFRKKNLIYIVIFRFLALIEIEIYTYCDSNDIILF